MRIGSISENKEIEKRVAITPEIVKKYLSLGFEICLNENYGLHLGISDKDYSDHGAKILKNENEILENSDLVVQLGIFSDDKFSFFKEDQTLIGVLDPYSNKEKLENLAKKKN